MLSHYTSKYAWMYWFHELALAEQMPPHVDRVTSMESLVKAVLSHLGCHVQSPLAWQ